MIPWAAWVASGPAFPVPLQHEGEWIGEPGKGGIFRPYGISTRDYFAAKAMQVMCMNADTWGLQADSVALEAYAMADAMLRARENT